MIHNNEVSMTWMSREQWIHIIIWLKSSRLKVISNWLWQCPWCPLRNTYWDWSIPGLDFAEKELLWSPCGLSVYLFTFLHFFTLIVCSLLIGLLIHITGTFLITDTRWCRIWWWCRWQQIWPERINTRSIKFWGLLNKRERQGTLSTESQMKDRHTGQRTPIFS